MAQVRGAALIAGITLAAALLGACSSGSTAGKPSSAASTPTPTPTVTSPTTPAPSSPSTSAATSKPAPRTSAPPSSSHNVSGRLPLNFTTGSATQVITAVASSTSSTQGVLQAWQRSASGWVAASPAVHAWFGTDGLTTQPSEFRSATPIGSFTLTQAFGHDANPGTSLPYLQTTPADWWISQKSPLYNTEQRCSSNCSFDTGKDTVNEHLYYETPFYDYAVVIDANRFPKPVYPDGSAFFLHVSVGAPTAGCVSIDKSELVTLLRWLKPGDHPRILIGLS